ncbi:type II toxin-antitoxin system VapC family toxin [Nonomuraea sp. NPDC050536]|uniref:type II toxin-antitoxin system VapC family toxin n=1 Tax=Nonomuraea sp. NPDC050536 TaxID=3364366 RepID=UPI0037C99ED9
MIIDTSAVAAILLAEPDAAIYAKAIADNQPRHMSAATYLELSLVMEGKRDPVASRRLDDWLTRARITITPVTHQQACIARRAYWDYGRGSGHPARLNFGDCFSYALARDMNEPLLFKGQDFIHTDIASAL